MHPRASGSGSFPLAVIYTGATKMPHFVIFEATFSKGKDPDPDARG